MNEHGKIPFSDRTSQPELVGPEHIPTTLNRPDDAGSWITLAAADGTPYGSEPKAWGAGEAGDPREPVLEPAAEAMDTSAETEGESSPSSFMGVELMENDNGQMVPSRITFDRDSDAGRALKAAYTDARDQLGVTEQRIRALKHNIEIPGEDYPEVLEAANREWKQWTATTLAYLLPLASLEMNDARSSVTVEGSKAAKVYQGIIRGIGLLAAKQAGESEEERQRLIDKMMSGIKYTQE